MFFVRQIPTKKDALLWERPWDIYNKIIIALLKDLDNLIQLAQDQKAKLIN